jgi:plasmid stabilization system protein ParE
MNCEIVYDAEARVKLNKAFEWFRVRSSVAQATQFLDAIDTGLAEIQAFPEAHQIIHPSGIRRSRVAGFRYSIIYLVDPDAIYIMAIAGDYRKPNYWLHRLDPNNET